MQFITFTVHIWKQFFGISCNTFEAYKGAYHWYAHYDSTGNVTSTQSYADYVPFGGWKTGSPMVRIKQIGGNVTVPLLCGGPAWHTFVD